MYFNPRSPCGERRAPPNTQEISDGFQSTLPVWGATRRWSGGAQRRIISIHAPRVGSDLVQVPEGRRIFISIHAPRVGSDSEKTNILFEFSVFQCIICCFSKNTYTLMIEYHIGSRMKSAFFGANLSKKSVHLLFASKQDRVFRHICTFTAEVIYFALIPVSKVIEPQTVLFHIHYTAKFRLQAAALSCVQQAFKYRALNPLTIVDTLFGNLTQPLSSGCILCIYIIGN